jgi:hypothetical protein
MDRTQCPELLYSMEIVYRVRDGQIAERWECLEDLEGHDRFWMKIG